MKFLTWLIIHFIKVTNSNILIKVIVITHAAFIFKIDDVWETKRTGHNSTFIKSSHKRIL